MVGWWMDRWVDELMELFCDPEVDGIITTIGGMNSNSIIPYLDFDKIKKLASRFIGSRVVEVTQNNYDTFINDNPGKPKVLLFSDKKGVPLIFKALSSHFDKTLLFGLIRDTEQGIVSKYKVKSYPAVFLLKEKDGKPVKYDGKEYNYQAIFDFINIYSETFVFRNNNEDQVVSAASKPWLSERVPQVTSDSVDDICLKKEGALCVIYVAKDAAQAKANEQELSELYATGQKFASKISRGINFYFMWLDATAESGFGSMFDVKAADLPKIVILKEDPPPPSLPQEASSKNEWKNINLNKPYRIAMVIKM
jgi:hypothetical protein